ncbi:hypothetical protein N8334_03770 [Flavobacteriaceae bacterium]|jgi:hypothetical protein|nr:hypothetical protein [Flavobacteriaceae bacterium]MDC1392444.1 hypothetical protein [Flavobacteriaceae bacterium]|tara:strand:- start:161 stop:574 length:414 start_codon:yes stop_codon:yes gene_type:complete
MRNSLIVCFIIVSSLAFSQRGKTGDKTFADRFPQDAQTLSSASLKMVNEVDHDIIVLVRDQEKKYLRHVYIRNNDEYTFSDLPITRLYVQFKSKEFYYEDKELTVINFGEKHTFNFFFDPSKIQNYIMISEEEFFKP